MVAMAALKTPVCTLCNMNFSKMEDLNIHMKNIHQETDDTRMLRLTQTVEAGLNPKPSVIIMNNALKVKNFDCSECGDIF